MKKITVGSLVFLVLFSCKGKTEKVIDFDDLTPASKKYASSDSSKQKLKPEELFFGSLSFLSKKLVDTLELGHESVFKLDTLIFPDRFGAEKTEKWYFKNEEDSLVFMHWKFRDSVKTENAFYNWLDCFGSNCRSIHVGAKISFSKGTNLFLVQDRDIFYFQSKRSPDIGRILACFDALKWNRERKFIVVQLRGKKAEWKKRDKEGEIVDFEAKIP